MSGVHSRSRGEKQGPGSASQLGPGSAGPARRTNPRAAAGEGGGAGQVRPDPCGRNKPLVQIPLPHQNPRASGQVQLMSE